MYGREARVPIDNLLHIENESNDSENIYITKLREKFKSACELAQMNQQKANEENDEQMEPLEEVNLTTNRESI